MELRHRILEFNHGDKYHLLKKELDKIHASYEIKEMGVIDGRAINSIEYWIIDTDPLYPHIEKLIRKYNFYVQTGLYYNKEDINSAEWLHATVGEFQYPQPEDTFKEATYDLNNFCQYCGIGKIQNHPFRLKSNFKQKRLDFLGLHWVFDEIFVRQRAKEIIEDNSLNKAEFIHPVVDKTGKQIDTLYQMRIPIITKPGLITTELETVTCKENNEEIEQLKKSGFKSSKSLSPHIYCGRVKYHYPKTTMLTFQRDMFNPEFDIIKSYEYFGSGAGAERLILVSKSFFNIIDKYKLRGIVLKPIKLV